MIFILYSAQKEKLDSFVNPLALNINEISIRYVLDMRDFNSSIYTNITI